jgi:hypothetical protein
LLPSNTAEWPARAGGMRPEDATLLQVLLADDKS